MNFRNSITNLRTFVKNADFVIKMAKRYIDAANEEGVAVSIKHFPGDGVDERDQQGILTGEQALSIIKNERHIHWARACADKGITLVKNNDNLLPLNNSKQEHCHKN